MEHDRSRSGAMRRALVLLVSAVLVAWGTLGLCVRGSAATPSPAVTAPSGLYMVNEAGNELPATQAYSPSPQKVFRSPAYEKAVTGDAIFVPIVEVLPSVSAWGKFNWSWGYLDALVREAVTHDKKFSIEFEVGYQAPPNKKNQPPNYLKSLPVGWASACDAAAAGNPKGQQDCAPLFDVWLNGGHAGGRCVSAYIPLPWVPQVQQFWQALATAVKAHLMNQKVAGRSEYSALTLIHLPGLSVYDEELRLPAIPYPGHPNTPCPDGNPPASVDQSITNLGAMYGYQPGNGGQANNAATGFEAIAGYFASAFPDKYLALSLFPGAAFPNASSTQQLSIAGQIIQTVRGLAAGHLLLQADLLDLGSDKAAKRIMSTVQSLARKYVIKIGFQSNRQGANGAACNKKSCGPDGANARYERLLANGQARGASYLEVWSHDVYRYPTALCAFAHCPLRPPNPPHLPPCGTRCT